MNENGFRVYDKEVNGYAGWCEWRIDQLGRLWFAECIDSITWKLADPDRYIVERATGIKVKTGRKVYDGDRYGRFAIQWDESTLGWWAKSEEGAKYVDAVISQCEYNGTIHDTKGGER